MVQRFSWVTKPPHKSWPTLSIIWHLLYTYHVQEMVLLWLLYCWLTLVWQSLVVSSPEIFRQKPRICWQISASSAASCHHLSAVVRRPPDTGVKYSQRSSIFSC